MTAPQYLKTALGRAKALSIAFGIVLIGIGFFSHFGSDWVKDTKDSSNAGSETIYSNCKADRRGVFPPEERKPGFGSRNRRGTCPHIAMEYAFLGVIVATLVITTASLIFCIAAKKVTQSIKTWDPRVYLGMGAVLLTCSVLYIVSAEMIKGAVGDDEEASEAYQINVHLRTVEKIIASVIGILQALVFLVIALLYRRLPS